MDNLDFTSEDEARVLSRLKGFQRETVDHVYSRFYDEQDPAKRFLVADEVGLGKTMVARGVVAKAIRELDRRGVERIDIVYVCSNLAIAGQNINRLNVFSEDNIALSSRLTLLPTTLQSLEKNRVNFVALTPGTSFDLKSRGGAAPERILVTQMLMPILDQLGLTEINLYNLMQATVQDRDRWRRWSKKPINYNESLAEAFRVEVLGDEKLMNDLREVAPHYQRHRISYPRSRLRYAVIGRLRRLLARVCVLALKPDLIILDEFQRFRKLLRDDSDMAELARDMMEYEDVRTLLLSATPYKMLTLRGSDEEDHHRDFVQTLSFLFGDEGAADIEEVRLMLGERRRSLYAADFEDANSHPLRDKLHEVMVRTERVDFTRDRDAMLVDRDTETTLTVDDLEEAAFIDQVADLVEARDPIEYWKSSPYLMNFMKGYQLKEKFELALEVGNQKLLATVEAAHERLLKFSDIENWRRVEPRNARLRKLEDETVDNGLWKLLWMPPALPYEKPKGVWKALEGSTKTLAFSAWNVVPDAVSVLLSYEAERRMTASEHDEVAYSEITERRGQLLNFAESKGRLTGMPALALLFPSPTLAAWFDPLEVAARDPEPADEKTMQRAVMGAAVKAVDTRKIFDQSTHRGREVGRLGRSDGRGSGEDESWHWASLAMIEDSNELGPWVERRWAEVSGDRDEGLRKHVSLFARAMSGHLKLGAPPGDNQVEETLASFAIASPAICALRALRRVSPELAWDDQALMSAAVRVAWGFRTLFNLSETAVMLRAETPGVPYWRLVLEYCRAGNLQAVLDEYVHVLVEQLGLFDVEPERRVTDVAEQIAEALSIRTSSLSFEDFQVQGGHFESQTRRVRTRFALRYGDMRGDEASTIARTSTVRTAFNSPFKPFVLISTSVGQEGLDFHTYCHRVWHWNLPHNPVDLEQREGRVHRYKGHAIRRAIANSYGLGAVLERDEPDPWNALFAAATELEDGNALHPFWLHEIEGGPRIERCVPVLPLSRDGHRLHELKRSLAVYRLAFGQARQDDLMAYLSERVGEISEEDLEALRVSLRPPDARG